MKAIENNKKIVGVTAYVHPVLKERIVEVSRKTGMSISEVTTKAIEFGLPFVLDLYMNGE